MSARAHQAQMNAGRHGAAEGLRSGKDAQDHAELCKAICRQCVAIHVGFVAFWIGRSGSIRLVFRAA
jgi:hypothetical protein